MAEANYECKSDEASGIEAPALSYRPQNPVSYRPKIALIGCGGISKFQLEAYRSAGYRVEILCDSEIERAKGRQGQFFPDAEVTTDYRSVLARDDIEVVDLATHPEQRLKLIEESLLAGKHVLSQKPFVTDLDQGERLVALAVAKDLRLAVNQNGRWAPHFSYIRQAIAAGLIGDVLSAHLGVHWNHNWIAGTPFDDVHHVVLYDFAIHWFDILTCFMSEKAPTRVFASLTRAQGQTAKPPLFGQALVEYDGAQATLAFDASTSYGSLDSTIVTGTLGTLSSQGPDLGSQTVTLTTAEGRSSPALVGTWFPDGLHGTMGELLCSIEENREPTNSAQNNLKSLALCFAAVRSAETGQPQIPGQIRTLTSQ